MVKKYRKKPVVIEAVQWIGENKDEVLAFIGAHGYYTELVGVERGPAFVIQTLEGKLFVRPNDWIIKGIKGEFYPCKPDIFEATYEEVTD